MQHLCGLRPNRRDRLWSRRVPCQGLVRFCALRRIEPHAPPLVRAPVNSFEFQPCGRTPQAECLMRLLRHLGLDSPKQLALIVYGVDYQGI